MWRVWNNEYDNSLTRSSSFLLLHSKTIVGLLYVPGRRLSLPFFPNPRVNWFMFVPKSLALRDIQKIPQHSTTISKTAGAVLKGSHSVTCVVPASNFLNNVVGILFTKTHQGKCHVCATLFDSTSWVLECLCGLRKSLVNISMLCVRKILFSSAHDLRERICATSTIWSESKVKRERLMWFSSSLFPHLVHQQTHVTTWYDRALVHGRCV